MGGRGGSSGLNSLKSQIAGTEADLKYAQMKAHEYGNARGGGTRKTREAFYEWNDEVRRLQNKLDTLRKKRKKR